MNSTEIVVRIESGEVQTQMGEYNGVAVEIYHNWIKIDEPPGVHWVPRDKVTEVIDLE